MGDLKIELSEVFGRVSPAARQAAAEVFSYGVESKHDLHEVVLDRLTPSSIRETGCWLISAIDSEHAERTLLSVVGDPDVRVRSAAVRWLGEIESKQSYDVLVQTLAADPVTSIRVLAAYALGWVGDQRAVEPLVRKMSDKDEDSSVRGEAAEALGNLGDARAVPALITALHDAIVEVRFWSAFALGKIGDKRALAALREAASTDSSVLPGWWEVSKEAADAIAEILGDQDQHHQ